MPAQRYIDENGLVAILATKRSVGVAPEVNLREHVICVAPSSANKKPRGDITRSPNSDISGPTKKAYVLEKFILKNKVRGKA